MDGLILHSADALSTVENHNVLWSSFCVTFNECSGAPLPTNLAFEDALRRLHLAHRFLKESLSKLQHHSFQMQEACRLAQMSAHEFAGVNAVAVDGGSEASKEPDSAEIRNNNNPIPFQVVNLVTKKVACIEENVELATEILYSVKWTTSAADWTRFALILTRGMKV